jgi:uncharacterized protein (DUF697 family)
MASGYRLLVGMWSRDTSLGIILGLLLVFTFVILPLTNYQEGVDLAAGLLASVLLLSGSVAVLHHPWVRGLASLVALTTIVVRCIGALSGSSILALAGATLTSLMLTLLVAVFLVEVYRPGPITRLRVGGAVAAYIVLGLAWAYGYGLLEAITPGSLHLPSPQQAPQLTPGFRAEVVYFSFATLTTLGYGDILPVSAVARSMAILEAMIGQLFIAALIGRLVSLRPPSPSRLTEPPPGE